ncbi:MAG: hypothetical protein GF315_10850 [candidate division Zixibacteria bacterium]|nr:hypothetical protein [candidate division Zixibacteria bacterium]
MTDKVLYIHKPFLILLILTLIPFSAQAAIDTYDTPNDGGNSITVTWGGEVIAQSRDKFTSLDIQRQKVAESAGWETAAVLPVTDSVFVDDSVKDNIPYKYRIVFSAPEGEALIFESEPVKSSPQFFNTKRLNVLIGVIICCVILFYYIYESRKGKKFYLRPIGGLQAIDDAVGRATEMGKPILYSAGRGKMQRVATIASMNVLSSVATKTAEYNTPLIFPNSEPVVAAVAQEVVYEAYLKAGHPDRYNPDDVFYLTDSQFGYAAAVDGIMVRRKPATNLFIGTFEAESLILAETGNSIGAIQIAGTDSTIQLAFFIVACDYFLIGEEYFAASGYLSKDPMVLGSLKGQDWLKIIVGGAIILGAVLETAGIGFFSKLFGIG